MQMQHELRKDLDTAGFIPCLHCSSFTTHLNPTRSPSHPNRESRWPCWCLLLDGVHGFSFDSVVVGDLRQWFLFTAGLTKWDLGFVNLMRMTVE
ncbi:hypothetical protein BDA96_01G355600 [Sorghum bicolor]|uniref:Uncharacterized protein n=1 Tax=Sorghum bicolor TaxID=4558 RepID=A0A921S3E7_SORBI|nr:hypothetical protein BDA96_01G355600 [Sorghum bicolor]